MAYLLDTNICIGAMNERPAALRARIFGAANRGELIVISSVVVFELRYGVEKSARVSKNARAVGEFLTDIEVIAFDADDAQAAAQIRADLERAGRPIGPYDCLIAGQAVRRGLTLVTANAREFARVPGLAWENWAE